MNNQQIQQLIGETSVRSGSRSHRPIQTLLALTIGLAAAGCTPTNPDIPTPGKTPAPG